MEIREFLEEVRKDTITEIIESLRFIAQGSYEETLRRKQYADKTGRLSSSIGWAISYDGKVVHSGGFTGQERKASAGQTAGRDVVWRERIIMVSALSSLLAHPTQHR